MTFASRTGVSSPQLQLSFSESSCVAKTLYLCYFVLVLYLFDVLSFVLVNPTHKRVHSQNRENVPYADWLILLSCCGSKETC